MIMPKECELCKHRLNWETEFCIKTFCSRCKLKKEEEINKMYNKDADDFFQWKNKNMIESFNQGKLATIEDVKKIVKNIDSGCANENPMHFAEMECCKDEIIKEIKKLENK